MPWSLEGERHDDPPEWEPSKAGPEYHLNRNAPPRCTLCGMPMGWDIDELGPAMRCGNKQCRLFGQPERP